MTTILFYQPLPKILLSLVFFVSLPFFITYSPHTGSNTPPIKLSGLSQLYPPITTTSTIYASLLFLAFYPSPASARKGVFHLSPFCPWLSLLLPFDCINLDPVHFHPLDISTSTNVERGFLFHDLTVCFSHILLYLYLDKVWNCACEKEKKAEKHLLTACFTQVYLQNIWKKVDTRQGQWHMIYVVTYNFTDRKLITHERHTENHQRNLWSSLSVEIRLYKYCIRSHKEKKVKWTLPPRGN